MTIQAALTMPQGLASFLPRGPAMMKKARALAEWSYWSVGAVDLEMKGIVHSAMWEQLPLSQQLSGRRDEDPLHTKDQQALGGGQNQAPSSRRGLSAGKMTADHGVVRTNASRCQRQDGACGRRGGGQRFPTPGCRACIYLGRCE